jgi:hypothetical protein
VGNLQALTGHFWSKQRDVRLLVTVDE